MAVTFTNEVEPMPEEARANKPVKKMPKASAWRCTKCGRKGHKRSACDRDSASEVRHHAMVAKLLPSAAKGLETLMARIEEDIADTEKRVSDLQDAQADLRALQRLRARLTTS